jgi:hypothetical protein
MWDDDPDIEEPLEDYEEENDNESESNEDLSDLAFDSALAADVEDDSLDKDGEDFDDED